MTAIPIAAWGRDHKTTLLYAESCAVDARGLIGNAHMRTDARRHPAFLARNSVASRPGQYPTRLAGGYELSDHDDWDCLWDFRALGLIVVSTPRDAAEWFDVDPGRRGPLLFPESGIKRTREGGLLVKVRLTDAGFALVGELRRQRAGVAR